MRLFKEGVLELVVLMIILVPSMKVYYNVFGNPAARFHDWNDLLSMWFLGALVIVASSAALRDYIIKFLKEKINENRT